MGKELKSHSSELRSSQGNRACDHLRFCSYCEAECGAQNKELLTLVKIAYTILGDIQHQWEGRHTAEGQGTLAAMRDAIAKATGQDPQAVQDDYCSRALAKVAAKQ